MPVNGSVGAQPTSIAQTAESNTAGPNPPTVQWTNPNGARTIGDSSRALAINSTDPESTYFLRATGYANSWGVPGNATITGVRFDFYAHARAAGGFGGAPDMVDAGVKLIIANSLQGNEKRRTTSNQWPPVAVDPGNGNPAPVVYGGPGDLWGLALTPADVNDSQFGVGFAGRWEAGTALGEFAVDAMVLTVFFTIPDPTDKSVVFTASVEQPNVAVSFSAAVATTPDRDVAFTAATSFGIVIEDPGAGCPTFTDASVVVTWSLTSSAVVAYRVQVYEDAAATIELYDSGFIGASGYTHTIPPGALPSPATNLYLRVTITNSTGVTVAGPLTCFNTSFNTSVNVGNVQARSVGGCDAPTALPGILVTWNQVTPGGGEAFATYDVRRRLAGSTVWKSIALLGVISTTRYVDANVAPRVTYEYSVVWRAITGVATLQSADTTPAPAVSVDFEFNFLHTASIQTDSADFAWLRLDSWQATKEVAQDIRYVQPWGRSTPTAYVGQALSHRITVPVHPDLLTKRKRWQTLLGLVAAQRDEGAILCLRFGRARELYYVTVAGLDGDVSQKSEEMRLGFVETFFEDA
jgi:hypothetical protein